MPTAISICADVIPRLGSAARASTFGGSAPRIGRLLDARLLDGGRVIARNDLRAFSDRQSSRQLKRSDIASWPCRYPSRSGGYENREREAPTRRRPIQASGPPSRIHLISELEYDIRGLISCAGPLRRRLCRSSPARASVGSRAT